MDRPPRGIDDPMFSRQMIGVSVVQGVFVLAAVLAVYLWAVFTGHQAGDVRALTFATLVFGNLSLIFVNRSWTHTILGGLSSKNPALWWVTAGTLSMLALLLAFPGTRDLFQFTVLHPADFAIALCAGVASVAWFEVYKLFGSRRSQSAV
jgi:Ca2+-transporting ATPase